MPRHFPESKIEDIWRDDLLEPSERVLVFDELDQFVVDEGTFVREEPGAWRVVMVIEEFLVLSNISMVVLLRLFSELKVFFQFFRCWERDSVDSLKRIIRFVA